MVGAKNKHWVSWKGMCFPKEEGGVGFRSLHDMSEDLFTKLWWIFRTSRSSLWSFLIWSKYCKKKHPLVVQGHGTSYVLRKMIAI